MNVSELTAEDCRLLVGKLSDGQREALRALCIHGHTKGAAKDCDTTPGAIKARLVQAYDRMGVNSGFSAAVIATRAGIV